MFLRKRGRVMTSLAVSAWCHLLTLDPKMLRQWLTQAWMSLHTHPRDARLKCFTSEHVFVMANLHDCMLQTPVPASFAYPTPAEVESRKPLLLLTRPMCSPRGRPRWRRCKPNAPISCSKCSASRNNARNSVCSLWKRSFLQWGSCRLQHPHEQDRPSQQRLP